MRSIAGDFTPFGYLRNPAHRSASWSDIEGGNLRTADDTLEFEFKVKPKSSASAFTVSVSGAKSGYKSTKFSLSLVPNSNLLTVTSIGHVTSPLSLDPQGFFVASRDECPQLPKSH